MIVRTILLGILGILVAILLAGFCGFGIGRWAVISNPQDKISIPPKQNEAVIGQEAQHTPGLPVDADALMKAFASMHDNKIVIEYSDSELNLLQDKEGQTDYAEVLLSFIETKLSTKAKHYQTVSQMVNPRMVLVVTENDKAYLVQLEQLHAFKSIWVVTSYSDLNLNGNEMVKNQYKLLQISDAPKEIGEWSSELLSQGGWKNESKTLNGKTYVLIKSSLGNFDSVELEDVSFFVGEVYIAFQSYEYENLDVGTKRRINDYLLIELAMKDIQKVSFTRSYSYPPTPLLAEPSPSTVSLDRLKQKMVLDGKFMELASMGKVGAIEFGIGAIKQDVFAKWGEPHSTGSRSATFYRWNNYMYFFTGPEDTVGSIIVKSESLPSKVSDIRKTLGPPKSEGEGLDSNWTLYYQAGEYEIFINADGKDGNLELLHLKKR
jgi:hypothetical protein